MNGQAPRRPASPGADIPVVRAIRKGIRVRKKQRPEDATAIKMHLLAQHWRDEAVRLKCISPGSDDHRAAVNAAYALERLPRNSLRCLVSTLDEGRDFALRCADLEILRAEHALQARKIGRLRILEGGQETGSQMLEPLVDEIGRAWERIFAQTIEMAETPVRNCRHLELKRRLVGKIWLGASGERYDRMRAGIAADEAWLAEHRPRRSRARREQ